MTCPTGRWGLLFAWKTGESGHGGRVPAIADPTGSESPGTLWQGASSRGTREDGKLALHIAHWAPFSRRPHHVRAESSLGQIG